MIFTPCLGIGDLIYLKWVSLSNNIKIDTINICKNLIQDNSIFYDTKLLSCKNTINILFPDVTINYINGTPNNSFVKLNISNLYIFDKIDNTIFNNISNNFSDYIVFHTKVRYDGLINKYETEIIPQLDLFFSSYKSNKTIVVIGERNMVNNKEVLIHKTFSLYNNILKLKNNNKIIDMTTEILVDGNDNFENFIRDISIINNSVCNVTFGLGGPYMLTQAFSKRNISFLPFIHLSPHYDAFTKINKISDSSVTTISAIIDKLNQYLL